MGKFGIENLNYLDYYLIKIRSRIINFILLVNTIANFKYTYFFKYFNIYLAIFSYR